MEDIDKRFSIMVNNSPKIENLTTYVKKYLELHPDSTISIGCDSIQRRSDIVFAVVIVLCPPFRKGSHVLYTRDFEDRKKFGKISNDQIFERLSKEAFRSIELYNFLNLGGIRVHSIELDYQKHENTASKPAYAAHSGWISSLGCMVLGKDGNDILPAIRAADQLVNNNPTRKKLKRVFDGH